jgi:hypothetical protein
MIKTLTIDGHRLDLIASDVQWARPVSIKHRIADRIETGLTARETRSPAHTDIRHEITATFALASEELLSWQAWLGRTTPSLGEGWVGLPMPCDVMLVSQWADAPRIYASDRVCVLASEDAPDIVPASLITPAWLQNLAALDPGILLAPLFVGRLKQRPKFAPISETSTTVTITLVEDSPWTFRLAPVAPAQGVPANWPEVLEANWRKAPEDSTLDSISYTDIGAARVRAVDGVEGAVRRSQKFTLTLEDREQVRLLLSFWQARRGRVESFTAPWLLRPGEETAITPHVTRARFAEDALTLEFPHADAAEARVSLQQVPWEIDPPAGETPAQPAEAFLYRFTIKNPDGAVMATWRYTNWVCDLTLVEENAVNATYHGDEAGLIEHDSLQQDSSLGDSSAKITLSATVPNNPLVPLAARAIDLPLGIEIFRTNPAAPNLNELVYTGTVSEVQADGRKLTAKTSVLGGLLDMKLPTFMYSPTCNWRFCDSGCGRVIASYTTTVTLKTQAGNQVTSVIAQEAPYPIPATADYLARGYLVTGAGAALQVRQITGNAARAGANITLTLKKPLENFTANAPATVRPDCDGQPATCLNRPLTGNGEDAAVRFANFGGHPRMGSQNLAIPQVTDASGSKGK